MMTKLKCWIKAKWDKNGRWNNIKKHKEIAIGQGFAGVRHIFYNKNTLKAPSQSNTLKVVKTKREAISFVKRFMKKHDRCKI